MGERDRLPHSYFEAGSIQGDQMSINNAEFTALENAVNRALDEIDRLRSENAELRAALETLLSRATELPQYANHEGLMNAEAIAQARAILERTKK
jgi:hypothetical protein